MDERLKLSLKETLNDEEKKRLRELNHNLEILQSGISERDPNYVAFLRSRHEMKEGTE